MFYIIQDRMYKKNIIFKLSIIIGIIFIIISGFIYSEKIYVPSTEKISGTITEFFRGSSSRYNKAPMHIIINDDKYIIISSLRWAVNDEELEEVLSKGNFVTIEFYYDKDQKNVVGIEYMNIDFVTVNDTIAGAVNKKNTLSIITLCIGYSILLFAFGCLILFKDKYDYCFSQIFSHKIYLSKLQIIFNIIIIILLTLLTLYLSIKVSKWLYFVFSLVLGGYIVYTFITTNQLIYDEHKIIFVKYGKVKKYNWNQLRQIISKGNKYRKIILNFSLENIDYNSSNHDVIINEKIHVFNFTKKNYTHFYSILKKYINKGKYEEIKDKDITYIHKKKLNY